MLKRAHPVFAVIIALIVAWSSVGFAQARHHAAGAQTLVICTGYGLVQITIDADGNPVERALPCPDCVVMPMAVLPDLGGVVARTTILRPSEFPLAARFVPITFASLWPSPRAPPAALV